MNPAVAVLVLLALIAFVIWGNLPSRKVKSPPDAVDEAKALRDREIGLIVGMLGGDIAMAAQVRYAVERLESQTGRIATPHEVGIAAGIVTGSQS